MPENKICDCGRAPGECVKGDLHRCPALDDEDDETMNCPGCGGSGQGIEDGADCDECCGTGKVSL